MTVITLPDGSRKTFPGDSVPVAQIVESLGERWRREAIAVSFGGRIFDLHQSISGEGDFRVISKIRNSQSTIKNPKSKTPSRCIILYPDIF